MNHDYAAMCAGQAMDVRVTTAARALSDGPIQDGPRLHILNDRLADLETRLVTIGHMMSNELDRIAGAVPAAGENAMKPEVEGGGLLNVAEAIVRRLHRVASALDNDVCRLTSI